MTVISVTHERRYPSVWAALCGVAAFVFTPMDLSARLPALAAAGLGVGGALFGVIVASGLFFLTADTPGVRRLRASGYDSDLQRYFVEGGLAAFVLLVVALVAMVAITARTPSVWQRISFAILAGLTVWTTLATWRMSMVIHAVWGRPAASKRSRVS